MRRIPAAMSVVFATVVLAAPVQAGETIVLTGQDAWTGVSLVGYNPYGNKKSFYATPLKYADWGGITVHSRGSDARKGAEEKTTFLKFELAKLPKDTKVAQAKLVFPVQRNAGKKNAVQDFDVLVPWTDRLDWKTADGETAWQVEGCHGEKDKKPVASFDVPDEKYDAKAPTELSCDVTDLVRKWVSDPSANHGIKLEMTGGYVVFAMKGIRLEVTLE